MSINLGIWNIKHDSISETTDSRGLITLIRTYIQIKKKICLNSRRSPDVWADPSSENPPQY